MSDTHRDKQRALDRRDLHAWFAGPPGAPSPLQRRPHWTQFGVPAWFTRLLRQRHRARVRHALRLGRHDSLPIEKKCAGYEWW